MKSLRLLGVTALTAGFILASDAVLVEEIIAKVNGDIITRSELERSEHQAEAELRQRNLTGARLKEAMEERTKNALRDRIDQLLLVAKGKELNINVDPEISKYIAKLQLDSKIADPDKFQQFVHEQTGMPFEDYKSEIKSSMLTERVIRDEIARGVQVKPDELRKYYDEHKADFVRDERVFLREILISTDGKDQAGIAAVEKKAKDVAARAAKGEKFSELARDNSDAASAPQGGDIGGFEKGKLRKDIEDAVWDQPRGFVSPPLKVSNGFLILRVEDHQKAGQATFEEVQNEIMDKLFTPRMQPAIRDYLTKLRQQAFLEIKPGYVDSGAAPGKDTTWVDPAQLKPETVSKEEVANQSRRKKFLGIVPIPGTTSVKSKDSSSR